MAKRIEKGERYFRDLTFIARLIAPDVYYFPNVDWQVIENDLAKNVTLSNSRKVRYYEVPISFDIETTSFQSTELEKCACMYAWGCSINGHVILGRTWEDFDEVYNKLIEMFEPDEKKRLLIYIQNLAYEFQFICKRFKWSKVFALMERKPIYAITEDNIEFRCSYMLSGYSLQVIGENLQRYRVQKKVGDLDYSLIRHYKTPLTETEWGYLISDVQVVVAYIKETAENDGGYAKIPLTKTGYVRNHCRKKCFANRYYRHFIKSLTLTYDEYLQLKRAFQGGYTHANWALVRQTIENMDSFDFTSSYPYVMVSEKFPMSKSTEVEITCDEDFKKYISNYCCLFDVKFSRLDGWQAPDHLISRSKCRNVQGEVINNGRIIYAESLETTINEVDYESLVRFYKWDDMQVSNFRIYEKSYLPKEFVEAILDLYVDKTVLKDVDGKEVEYMKSKGMVNSCYGMCVTDIIRDEDTYTDEWISKEPDGDESIDSYNNSKQRFLFYPWGIWVTAYARRNLFTGIYEFQNDYVYSDTDSVKVRNIDNHRGYIEEYNKIVYSKLERAMKWHRIPIEKTRPKTIKGVEKPLGIWDYDGHYTRFKTLGAKRYMTEKNGKVNITVAGLSKTTAVPYIQQLAEQRGCSMFDVFDDQLYVPGEYTGKQIHTYNDNEFSSRLNDYLGNEAVVHEYSSIHLAPAEYSLSIEYEFMRLVKGEIYVKE